MECLYAMSQTEQSKSYFHLSLNWDKSSTDLQCKVGFSDQTDINANYFPLAKRTWVEGVIVKMIVEETDIAGSKSLKVELRERKKSLFGL